MILLIPIFLHSTRLPVRQVLVDDPWWYLEQGKPTLFWVGRAQQGGWYSHWMLISDRNFRSGLGLYIIVIIIFRYNWSDRFWPVDSGQGWDCSGSWVLWTKLGPTCTMHHYNQNYQLNNKCRKSVDKFWRKKTKVFSWIFPREYFIFAIRFENMILWHLKVNLIFFSKNWIICGAPPWPLLTTITRLCLEISPYLPSSNQGHDIVGVGLSVGVVDIVDVGVTSFVVGFVVGVARVVDVVGVASVVVVRVVVGVICDINIWPVTDLTGTVYPRTPACHYTTFTSLPT